MEFQQNWGKRVFSERSESRTYVEQMQVLDLRDGELLPSGTWVEREGGKDLQTSWEDVWLGVKNALSLDGRCVRLMVTLAPQARKVYSDEILNYGRQC